MFSADFKLCPKPQNIRLHHLLHRVWFVLLSCHFGQPFCCSLQHSLNPVSSGKPGFTFHGLDVILKRLMRTPFEPLFVCILIFFFFYSFKNSLSCRNCFTIAYVTQSSFCSFGIIFQWCRYLSDKWCRFFLHQYIHKKFLYV